MSSLFCIFRRVGRVFAAPLDRLGRTAVLTALTAVLAQAGCGDDGATADAAAADATTVDATAATDAATAVDADASGPICDPTLRPVVFAHGFLAASDTWSLQVARLEANGQCADHVAVLDWNTLVQDGAEDALDAVIDRVRAATGAEQVDLVGHSAGGGLGYRYLADPAHAAKVAHYAHLASIAEPGPAGPEGAPVATLAVRSLGDTIVESAADIAGATNVVLDDADHYEVATSPATFVALWRHFHGADPATTAIPDDPHPTLAGGALVLGDNTPVAGFALDLFAVDPSTGARLAAAPDATFTIGADGAWGPFAATAGAAYELLLHGPGAEDRPVHYYVEPVHQTNRLLYVRALPGPDSLVGALLAGLPFDDRQVDLIVFSSSKAVLHGRDTLTVGARDLATPELTAATRTAIAFFLFDEGTDQTSGGEAALFASVLKVFLTGVDEYLAAADAGPIAVSFDGRSLALPRWPSASAGATVAIFR